MHISKPCFIAGLFCTQIYRICCVSWLNILLIIFFCTNNIQPHRRDRVPDCPPIWHNLTKQQYPNTSINLVLPFRRGDLWSSAKHTDINCIFFVPITSNHIVGADSISARIQSLANFNGRMVSSPTK